METSNLNKDQDNTSRCRTYSDSGIIWIVVALLVGTGLRGYFLSQPMRYDESFTFLNFVGRDLKYLFFYPLPNNHVLYSILTKITTVIWGKNPVAIRLIAFLAGIAIIPLIYRFCRRVGQSGVFASAATAVLPYFVLYSTNARGYTLIVLITLILALIGLRIVENPSTKNIFLFSLTAALGMLTMPSMLFPIAGIYLLVILLQISSHNTKKEIYIFAFQCIIMTVLLTILFYIPVILVSNGIESILANRFVKAQPWPEFIRQILPHFDQTIIDFTRDIPYVLLLATAILTAIGLYSSVRKSNLPVIYILPSLLLTSLLIFVIKQKIPFERTWIYFIPFIIIVADCGFTYIVAMVEKRIQYSLHIGLCCMCIYIAISVMSRNAIISYTDTGTFVEAEIAAKYLMPIISTNDKIYARPPADWPLNFYLWYHNVPRIEKDPNQDLRREFFIVKKSSYSITEMTIKQYTNIMSIGDLAIYQATDNHSH